MKANVKYKRSILEKSSFERLFEDEFLPLISKSAGGYMNEVVSLEKELRLEVWEEIK